MNNRTWLIKLPYPKPPLSMNFRMHWRQEAAIRKQLMQDCRWMVKAAKIPPLDQARVTLVWTVPDRRARDSDNPAPTEKVCVDSLVREKILKDDTPNFLKRGETEIVYMKGVRELALRIEELA